MNSLKGLIEKRNEKVEELRAILNTVKTEVRAFTAEENEKREALNVEIKELNATIEALKNDRYSDENEIEDVEEENEMSKEIRSAKELQNLQLVNYLAGKDMFSGMTVEERAVVGMGKEGGSSNPSDFNPIKTNDDESAVIIPEVLETNFVEFLEEESNVVALVEKIPSVKGTYHIMLEDETIVNQMAEGVLEGEAPQNYGKIKFRTVPLITKRFVAQYKVTQQMIMNSSIDIVAYVLRQMAKQHARKIEHDIFQGSGNNQQGDVALHGIDGETHIRNVETAVKDAIAMDDLNKLSNAILPQFVNGAKFFVSPDAYRKIALLKDADGHYYLQNGVVNGRLTKTILGFEVVRCPYMTASAPVYFGNLGQCYAMMIRKGMELQHVSGDTQNAQARTHLLILDVFMDGCVKNPQALVRLKNKAN